MVTAFIGFQKGLPKNRIFLAILTNLLRPVPHLDVSVFSIFFRSSMPCPRLRLLSVTLVDKTYHRCVQDEYANGSSLVGR
jgi:hypothetical protein